MIIVRRNTFPFRSIVFYSTLDDKNRNLEEVDKINEMAVSCLVTNNNI